MQIIIDEFFKPFEAEITYTVEVLMKEYLKIPSDVEILIYYGKNDIESKICDSFGIQIIPSNFFNEDTYLTSESMPREPLSWVNASDLRVVRENFFDSKIPILYAERLESTQIVEFKRNHIVVHIDLIASIFFMLTRYEEKINPEKDGFARFPIQQSLSIKHCFYHRPVVNEYLELIRDWLKKLSPALIKNNHKFTIQLTHDIDQFRKYKSFLKETVRLPYEIGIRQGKLGPALNRFAESVNVFRGARKDPCNTFEQLMDISEENGVRSVFYFMADEKDGRYKISDPKVHETIKTILTRGHEVGLHPNFGTYDSYEKMAAQKDCLDKILGYTNYGARQHYLQWKAPDTWRIYEKAGLTHDSSLGHIEMPGFRCGSCYPYPVFDFDKKQKLSLIEIPLIVMDASVYSVKYENFRGRYFKKIFGAEPESFNIVDFIFYLKRQAKKFNGCFSILWHNCRLENFFVSDYIKLIKNFYPNPH